MIEAFSYDNVNGLKFGASPEEAIKVFGEPENIDTTDKDEKIFYYPKFALSFKPKKGFFYIGIMPKEKVTINGVSSGWTLKEIEPIIRMDSNPVVDGADIILRDLGVDFINFHDIEDDDVSERAISLFAKDEIKVYDTEKPFELISDIDNHYNRLKIIE